MAGKVSLALGRPLHILIMDATASTSNWRGFKDMDSLGGVSHARSPVSCTKTHSLEPPHPRHHGRKRRLLIFRLKLFAIRLPSRPSRR